MHHSPISLPISPNFSKIPTTPPVRRCFIIFLTLSTKIRNASEISSEILSEITYFGKFWNASEMHHKYLFSPSLNPEPPSPVQFLSIFCFLHIHPQLLHLILNSHISAPPTHPKTSKKSKYLPTISVNPPTHRPILLHPHLNFFQIISPHFNHFKQKQYFHKTTNLLKKNWHRYDPSGAYGKTYNIHLRSKIFMKHWYCTIILIIHTKTKNWHRYDPSGAYGKTYNIHLRSKIFMKHWYCTIILIIHTKTKNWHRYDPCGAYRKTYNIHLRSKIFMKHWYCTIILIMNTKTKNWHRYDPSGAYGKTYNIHLRSKIFMKHWYCTIILIMNTKTKNWHQYDPSGAYGKTYNIHLRSKIFMKHWYRTIFLIIHTDWHRYNPSGAYGKTFK